jgi:hypothetical protein
MARVVGRCWSLVALSVLRLTMVPHKAATAFMLACGNRASTSKPARETVVICLGEMVPDATGEYRELPASKTPTKRQAVPRSGGGSQRIASDLVHATKIVAAVRADLGI